MGGKGKGHRGGKQQSPQSGEEYPPLGRGQPQQHQAPAPAPAAAAPQQEPVHVPVPAAPAPQVPQQQVQQQPPQQQQQQGGGRGDYPALGRGRGGGGGRGRGQPQQPSPQSSKPSSVPREFPGSSPPRSNLPIQQVPAPQVPEKPTSPEVKKGRGPRRENDNEVKDLAISKRTESSAKKTFKVAVNQFVLKFNINKLYLYAVDFVPEIENRRVRFDILNAIPELGIHQFDGSHQLYSIKKEATRSFRNAQHQTTVTIQFAKEINQNDNCSIHFYNILFKRFMRDLGYSMIGRQYFNPNGVARIDGHQMEIWPGFFTSINNIECGTALLCDVAHKVVRTQNLYDYIQGLLKKNSESKVNDMLAGSIIITKYNNKTYRVKGVEWKMSIQTEFEINRANKMTKISYFNYFRQTYPDMAIRHNNQFMISTQVKFRGKTEIIYIPPELSFMTGIDDEIAGNRQAMADLVKHTYLSPYDRAQKISNFVASVRKSPVTDKTIKSWGFSMGNMLLAEGHKLDDPKTIPNSKVFQNGKWCVIIGERDTNEISKFVEALCNMSGLQKPLYVNINPTRSDLWTSQLSQLAKNKEYLFYMCVIPTGRKDIYDTIKKTSLINLRIITQVALVRTLQKGYPVAVKILSQVIAKLGQSPWRLSGMQYKIPQKTMVIGIDVGHNSDQRGKSVVGFVASINDDFSLFHTTAICQSVPGKEIVESLGPSMSSALRAYYMKNNCLPSVVIVYRDGVGDGMLGLVRKYEVAAIKEAIANAPSIWGVKPQLLYSVVKKNTNVRFFDPAGEFNNLPAGTIVDKVCTHPNWYDFYLVSQISINKSSVNPTHYHVIVDETNISDVDFQLFTYHMCFMYYNFDKSVRVPAPAQYAHKLAFLIGRHVHASVAEELSLNLYFL